MYIDKIKIKEAMSKKGIETQTQLANLLNITKNQLSVMLSEKYTPIKSNVSNLCDILEISPFEIISDKTPQYAINELAEEYFVTPISSVSSISNKHSSVNAIELFAGGGGLALGLELAGINTVLHVEIDKYCCETLKKNRPHWNIMNNDIKYVDFKPYKSKVEIVTGGFPCQAFSFAGKKLGFEDVRGTLFYEFARCVKEVEPLMFMAENVRGLISHDDGRKKYCQIKAGPNTINKDDIKTIIGHFTAVKNLARTNNNSQISLNDLVVGVFYGTPDELSMHYKKINEEHPVYIGKDFWYRLTGEKDFYFHLIKAFDEVAINVDGVKLLDETVKKLSEDIKKQYK